MHSLLLETLHSRQTACFKLFARDLDPLSSRLVNMSLANRSVFVWVAAALWLLILNTANAGGSTLNGLVSDSEEKEMDYDQLDNLMNGDTPYEPINQPDPLLAGSSDIPVVAPITESDNFETQTETVAEVKIDKLFHQFRLLHFRAKTLDETTVHLEWTIMNATNGLDSDRLLNISTISTLKTESITLNRRVTMGKEICHKYSDLIAKCNFTVPVESCSNYQFRLGGERNTEHVTTVQIDPRSLLKDLSEMANAPAKLRWKITCDADFMMPVFVTLTDMKTSIPKKERLNATCENRSCVTTTEKLRTSPCSQYSLKIDGSDLRIVNTPPITKNLTAEVIPWKFQYSLRWSITPMNCPFNPVLMVAKTKLLEKPVFSRLTLQASSSDFCKKGFCEYVYEVEPCVTHWIRSGHLDTSTVKLLQPSVLELASVFNSDLNHPVRLSWKLGCHFEKKHFSIALIDEITREKQFSLVNATCDEDSRRCGAYLDKDQNRFLPCNRYEMEMEGGNDVLTIETPPPSTVSVRPLSSFYTTNGTLIISILFEGIQQTCGMWKNSIELQLFDLPSKAMVLPCENHEATIPLRKNCTVSLQIGEPNLMCHSKLNIAIRPLYSRPEKNYNLYRGSWFNAIIKPLIPETWSDVKALSDLIVNANASQQSMAIEWRNPICIRGSAISQTKLIIISPGTIELQEYHLTIPYKCSRSNRNPTKSSIVINNGQITCSDGKTLPDQAAINLTPCTNYSLRLTPIVIDEAESFIHGSAAATFNTEFIPLEVGEMSPDSMKLVATQVNGAEWILKLHVQKKRCPCDDRITSAIFKIPGARLMEQAIPCSHNITCTGIVEFNHLNLCIPLAVTVGFQYSKMDTDKVFWYNKTIPPIVNESDRKGSSKIDLNTSQINRHMLQLNWENPICLNGVVASWNLEFRQRNGSLFRVINIPYNCSGTREEFSAANQLYLEAGQLLCQAKREFYDINLSPCSNYTLVVTPDVEGQSPTQLSAFSKSVNFTSLFSASNVGDVKIVSVTSDNFELYWTIPSQCVSSAEIEMEVNGTVFSIKPSVDISGSNMACDAEVCQISRKIMPVEGLLAPCSDYSIRIEANNLTFTTFPGDDELEMLPDKTSVTATNDDNHSHLNIEMAFQTLDVRCSTRLPAIELQLPDVYPLVQHVLSCKAGSKANNENSTALVCSGRVLVQRMDICQAIPIIFRPLYKEISFASQVRWTSMDFDPLLSKLQRNEKKVIIPEVNVVNGDERQSTLVKWQEPQCLLADSLSWEIRINSTADDVHHISVPVGCSSARRGSFEHAVKLDDGHLSGCNDSTNALEFSERNFTFSPCSSYLVSIIPVQRNSNITVLDGYAQSVLLKVPFATIVPNITNVTSNMFRLEWSFPLECLLYIEMNQTTVEINGTEIEINPLTLPLECDEIKCTRKWTSPENLTSCTGYTILANSIVQKVFTLPDIDQPGCDSNYATSVLSATAMNYKWTSLTLIVGLSMLGSILLGLLVGIGFGVHKRKTETGKLDIKKRTNAHSNQPMALRVAEDTNVSGVAF